VAAVSDRKLAPADRKWPEGEAWNRPATIEEVEADFQDCSSVVRKLIRVRFVTLGSVPSHS
jgi:hypothetical protein